VFFTVLVGAILMIKGKPYQLAPLDMSEQQEYVWGSHSMKPDYVWHLHKRSRFTAICDSYTNVIYHVHQFADVNVLPTGDVCEECLACWTLLQF
jgi:hypothetical protein